MFHQHKTYSVFATGLFLALSSVGCGNMSSARMPVKAPSSAYAAGSGFTATETSSSSALPCSGQSNIFPDYDYTFDGANHFAACAVEKDVYKVDVSGESSGTTQEVCIFPAQAYDSERVYVKRDTKGVPLFQCASLKQGKVQLNFPYTNFNALFIVNSEDKNAMQACLAAKDYYACPRQYSYGQFR